MGHGAATALLFVAAYLLGSIPFSYLVARRRGIDVRTVGSGNVGATNVMRAAGRAAGLTAFALDFVKGAAATALVRRLAGPAVVRQLGTGSSAGEAGSRSGAGPSSGSSRGTGSSRGSISYCRCGRPISMPSRFPSGRN